MGAQPTAYPTPTPRGMYSSPGPEPTPSPPAPTATPTAAPTAAISYASKFSTKRLCSVAMVDRYEHASLAWNCCDEGAQYGFCVTVEIHSRSWDQICAADFQFYI